MPRPCCSSSTSATPRPTSAPTGTASSSSTGASPPCATRPPTSSAPRCATCSRCAGCTLETHRRARSSPRRSRSCGRSGRAMARRYLGARRADGRARAAAPGCRSATTTRARSGPTGSSTRSRATSGSAAPCVVVDFGTAVTHDVVSAAGEYLGGVIFPGVEISLEALTERAAALPEDRPRRPPRALIGKSTVDAIRSGIIYGYAGDGRRDRRAAARGAGGGDARARHRRAGRRGRAVLRVDRRGRRPAHAQRACG